MITPHLASDHHHPTMANNNCRKKSAISAKAVVGKATIQVCDLGLFINLILTRVFYTSAPKQDKLPKEDADKLKDMIDHVDRKKGLKLLLEDGRFKFITLHQMYAIVEIADGVGDQVDILAPALLSFGLTYQELAAFPLLKDITAMIKGIDCGSFLLGDFLIALRALQKDVAVYGREQPNILVCLFASL
jgi:hypothetical protein